MLDSAQKIVCPTLVLESEGDPVGGGGRILFDALGSTVTVYLDPPASSGLAGHCGGLGQQVWERLVFDWLDTVLTPTRTAADR
ncbi:hypothetical protein [Rhodococcoides yunnanense]|uniref:hypothetical protein n=1 Tax=Rhodococcoides yunnanense TaxID=278209 RepID=UPI0009352A45|nr:hypothetical protein [Rhodococcus yunnanensis]